MSAADSARRWVSRWWRGEEQGVIPAGLTVALAPAEAIFRTMVHLRRVAFDSGLLRSEGAPVPVVSVGNITVGGTGKTPVSAWIAHRLRRMGQHPAIVLRGYGQDEVGVHRELNPGLPVVAAPLRMRGVREAMSQGATCVVLDDAFQHRRVRRDVDIVLVSAERWAGSKRMLPRGPWREPLEALRRATHVLVTRKTATRHAAKGVVADLTALGFAAPIGIVHLAPAGFRCLKDESIAAETSDIRGRRVIALSTLADPAPFIAHLRDLGAAVEPIIFSDHHEFSDAEIRRLVEQAAGDVLVMTRKEAVKVRDRAPEGLVALVQEQEVVFEEGLMELEVALDRAVADRR
jgi:tetraacyldisaccharide 4'-kinase